MRFYVRFWFSMLVLLGIVVIGYQGVVMLVVGTTLTVLACIIVVISVCLLVLLGRPICLVVVSFFERMNVRKKVDDNWREVTTFIHFGELIGVRMHHVIPIDGPVTHWFIVRGMDFYDASREMSLLRDAEISMLAKSARKSKTLQYTHS